MEAKSPTNDEVPHLSHPQHSVSLTFAPGLYTCDACKEHGAGNRYTCNSCHLNIHEFCAKAAPSIAHPSHTQHHLIFHAQPRFAFPKSKCGLCGEVIKGFAFCCDTCHFSIHPCCAQLPQELEFVEHSEHTLNLLANSPCAAGDGSYTCNVCGKKGSGWVYYCAECGFYLHAMCAKPFINGLQGQDIGVPSEPSKIRRASGFGTNVLHRFIDSTVEVLENAMVEPVVEGVFDQISTFLSNLRPSEEEEEEEEEQEEV